MLILGGSLCEDLGLFHSFKTSPRSSNSESVCQSYRCFSGLLLAVLGTPCARGLWPPCARGAQEMPVGAPTASFWVWLFKGPFLPPVGSWLTHILNTILSLSPPLPIPYLPSMWRGICGWISEPFVDHIQSIPSLQSPTFKSASYEIERVSWAFVAWPCIAFVALVWAPRIDLFVWEPVSLLLLEASPPRRFGDIFEKFVKRPRWPRFL